MGDIVGSIGANPAKIGPRDKINNPADGIGTVDSGSTVLEDFDALNGGERNRVEIDDAAVEAVGGNATTVEEN